MTDTHSDAAASTPLTQEERALLFAALIGPGDHSVQEVAPGVYAHCWRWKPAPERQQQQDHLADTSPMIE